MELYINDRYALVTGSYRGTGRVIAATLLKENAKVIVHGFDKKQAEEAAKDIGAEFSVFGDITEDNGAEHVFRQIMEKTGHIDILINNYGTAGIGKWSSIDTGSWLDMFQKNTISAARMISLAISGMKERKYGRIIQLGTIGSTSPNKVMPHYYASKAAVANMTVSLAKELANTGITVNTVSPGLIKTEELESFYREKAKRKGWGESWDEIESAIVTHEFPNPVGRIARPEEIANVVAFLCSEKAGFINGQNIRIDGGAIGVVQ